MTVHRSRATGDALIAIDFGSVQDLVKAFGWVPLDLRRELRPLVREAGENIARIAKQNAAWSSHIPGAIRVRTSFSLKGAGATVWVDRVAAPEGRVLEGIPHRPLAPSRPQFRHPVFGDTHTWVTQKTQPYLMPAAISGGATYAAAVGEAVRRATKHLVTAMEGSSHV